MRKKVLLSVFSLFILTIIFACGPGETIDYTKYLGEYTLESVYLGEEDITSEYSLYKVVISENNKMTVNISTLGRFENRESTYTVSNDVIKEVYNNKEYEYIYDSDKLTSTQESGSLNMTITLVKVLENITDNEVDFESVLFGEGIDSIKKFNYAPAAMIEKDASGKDIMHVWYCTNKNTGVIVDHIGYRTGEMTDSGKWIFSEEKIVLAPTPNTWDGRHTCDPTVIKGEFKMAGTTYNYMMSYLGCVTEDYSNNETGIAVSVKPEGPWIKVDHLNPIAPWNADNQSGTWGTGMPSLVSIDGKGKVLLLYPNVHFGVAVESWDFSDLDALTKESSPLFKRGIISTGLQRPDGRADSIGIPDFAYDEEAKRFYTLSRSSVKNPADETKTLVNSHAVLAYFEADSMEEVATKLSSGNYSWTVVDFLGPDNTGFPRNHNSCIVRNPFGYIIDSNEIWAITSTGQITYPTDNIFTYRLRGHIFHLND